MLPFFSKTRQRLRDAEAQLRLADTEQRIAAVIFDNLQGVIVANARGVIQRVNDAFTRMSGYSAAEVIGKTPRMLRSGHHDESFYVAMRESLARTGRWQGEIWDRHKSGELFPKWMTITAVRNAAGAATHFVATYIDITERKRAEEQINRLAFYDVLTELPNRSLLLEMLQRALATSAKEGRHGAVLLIDLDRFKLINDTLGHTQGDVLLQQAGQRLRGCVRETDTVARIGGDEFAVVLAELHGVQEHAVFGAERVGEKIVEALARPYLLGDGEYRCTGSVGVALFAGGQPAREEILKQAELAMYKAKHDGGNGLRFFDAALEEAANRRVFLERELDKAVAAEQFILHYQPQVRHDGSVYGAEALLRWHHPERGLISPAEFVPLAEETGHILALGNWVLETACRQLAAWARQPRTADLVLAVNVSALQFMQDDFVDRVLCALRDAAAEPGRLKLELTESLLASDPDAIIEKMHVLKTQGVRLALDDFGTGYSSLAYLKRMPFDQLKIDQSFVRDVLTDTNAAAIARAIAALAHSLGLMVVAEGVETAAQRDFLAATGCVIYQGDHFSRPLPLAQFEAWLP